MAGELTEDFAVNKGLKHGHGLALMLYKLALKYAVRKTSVDWKGTLIDEQVYAVLGPSR